MSSGPTLSPCSHCNSTRVSFSKKSGTVGITRTRFYRETVRCKHCNIEVTARTPGNAVALWNRASSGSDATRAYYDAMLAAVPSPTVTDEMVKAAAQALYEADEPWHSASPWPDLQSGESHAADYRRLARAALTAALEAKP